MARGGDILSVAMQPSRPGGGGRGEKGDRIEEEAPKQQHWSPPGKEAQKIRRGEGSLDGKDLVRGRFVPRRFLASQANAGAGDPAGGGASSIAGERRVRWAPYAGTQEATPVAGGSTTREHQEANRNRMPPCPTRDQKLPLEGRARPAAATHVSKRDTASFLPSSASLVRPYTYQISPMDCANLDRILKLRMKHTHKEYVHSLFVWLVLICSERKVLLASCWFF
jgi:hypothetical protein